MSSEINKTTLKKKISISGRAVPFVCWEGLLQTGELVLIQNLLEPPSGPLRASALAHLHNGALPTPGSRVTVRPSQGREVGWFVF